MNGFGLEFFVECPAGELTQKGDDVAKSWQFQLLYTVSQLAAGVLLAASRHAARKLANSFTAGHGGIRSILDDMKLLSTEAEGVNEAIPSDLQPKLVNEQGRVGALLGLKASSSSAAGACCCLRLRPATQPADLERRRHTAQHRQHAAHGGPAGQHQAADAVRAAADHRQGHRGAAAAERCLCGPRSPDVQPATAFCGLSTAHRPPADPTAPPAHAEGRSFFLSSRSRACTTAPGLHRGEQLTDFHQHRTAHVTIRQPVHAFWSGT